MTGERGNDRCYFCGGRLEASVTMLPFVVGNNIVIIKQIPAEVCTQCGEAVMNNDVAKRVDGILKQAHKSGFEVSIVTYRQPATVAA